MCALLLVPETACAEEPATARLVFERAGEAARCIDETELRERVAARLGRDPFVEEATVEARVRIDAVDGARYRAVIELVDGEVHTRRELESARADCADLADALALALSLAVDPTSLLAPVRRAHGPPASPTPEPPAAPAAPREVETSPPPPSTDVSADVSLRFAAHVFGSWGVAPEVSGGLALSTGLRIDDFSIDLELRTELPTEVTGVNGTVRGAPFTAGIVPCAHVEVVTLCALARGGAFWGEAVEAESARSGTAPYLALGVRGGLEIPLSRGVALAVLGEVSAPLIGTQLVLGSELVWETPPVGVSLGAGVIGALR